jgi:acyl-coenzyme A synthetase/AMP-(fatty) acid ligase
LLETLNTFLCTQAEAADKWILWRDISNGPAVTLAQFQHELSALRSKLADSEAQRWLLYSDDPHHFLLGLLALLGLKKKVVISASLKPDWLQSLNTEFDAILSDDAVAVPGANTGNILQKPCCNFEPSVPDGAPWLPGFDGTEQIVFFTSGSTGQPKAIEKTLLALTNEVTTLGRTFRDVVEGGVFIASVSHLHIYGLLFKLLLPLLVKAPALRQQIEYPEQLLGLAGIFKKNNNAVFISSPTFLSRLDPGLPPVTMKAVFSSGGPLAFSAAQASRDYFSQLPVEVYGSTETGGIGYRQQAEPTTPWTAFRGIQLSMSDEGVQLLSPNMPGQSPYLLDDQLEFLPDGRFLLKGRKDRVIKIAEKRISLTEIEKFLEAQPTISQCVALPLYARRDVIGCAVVLTEEGKLLASHSGERMLILRWKAAMHNRFEPVTIPRQWRILAAIPVNSQSKIDHNKLLAEFGTNKAGNQESS